MNFTTMMAAASINNGLTVAAGSGNVAADEPEGASPPIGRHYTVADIPPGFLANASSIINEHGIRLISKYEGPPRLKARLCEGGRFELGKGITFHFDGRPVLEGETCDEEYAEALFVNALSVFAKAVDELVTVPINANQRGALTILSYNIGIENFKTSTVLRETNAGRFDDAAAAFGMWVFATKNGYKQALRGLLRRQYATACYYLSYDDSEACADDAIALQRQKPATLPGRDTVIYKTPFKDVLRVAQRYPLSPATQPAPEAKTAPAVIPDSARAIPDTPAPQPAPNPPAKPEAKSPPVKAGGEEGAALDPTAPQPTSPPPRITVPASPPPPVKPSQTVDVTKFNINNIKVENGAKPLETSDRAVAVAYKIAGVGLKKAAGWGFVPVGAADAYFEIFGDPFVAAAVVAGTVWLVGEALEWWGNRKRKKHNATATTLLY